MASEVWKWSAGEITARVAARQISVASVIQCFLDRATQVNPVLNAVCTPTADMALAAAAAADRRLAMGYPPRALEGVPFTVKDNIPAAGVRCTYGSELYRDLITSEDAISVERLKHHGGILVGKTNTPEMADDPFCNTTNELFGQTRNPWDVNRTPGGSTGGGAAATAAGIAPLALGTDWGGSIRGPAAFCGVVGFRPSAGLIATYPDDTRSGFAWDFAVEHNHAPMARTVPDVARAFEALVGPDPRAPAALPAGVVAGLGGAIATDVDLRGHRVAVSVDFGGLAPVEQAVAKATRSAAETLEALGCEVTEACPDFSPLNEIIPGTRALGVMLRYSGYTKAQLDKLSPRLRAQIDDVASVDLASVARAERLRSALFLEFHRFMQDYDYLLTPTWGVVPFRIDVPLDYTMDGRETPNYFDCILFTYAMSVLGTPSISVPAPSDANNLPIGVQLAGPRYSDSKILSAAAAFESARGGSAWPPEIDATQLRPADPTFVESGGSVAWRSLDANQSGSE